MRQIFDEKKINTSLFLQLENLMLALIKEKNASLEYGFQSYYDEHEHVVVISHFWDSRKEEDQVIGLKSEVYLKAFGYKVYSDMSLIRQFAKNLLHSPIRNFLTQLFVLLEDLRVEEEVIRNRPGTKRIFRRRKAMYRDYFQSQYEINRIRNFQTDMLFCLCYMTLTSETYVSFTNEYWETIEPILHEAYQSNHTKDTVNIIENIRYRLEEYIQEDMINTYFGLAPQQTNVTVKNEQHHKKLNNCDVQKFEEEENHYKADESFSTWHRENKNNENENFLRFELESGTKTNLMGNTARESEDQDQALGSVKGSSQNSNQTNFDKADMKDASLPEMKTTEEHQYGKFNVGATYMIKHANKPTSDEKEKYKAIKTIVQTDVRGLKKTIEKTIENKQNANIDKFYGRLRKKFLRVYTEKHPRLFYKKGYESKELDAVFQLLIDCSGSMYNKMEETKKSAVLFHEALQSLKIPHAISGFWEDASNATKENKPNIVHHIISFENSMIPSSGPEIMQLHEEEDNRDGYIIRILSEALAERTEKHKFLLVFTDGEPSALDYQQDGILDTYEAVKLARKKGLDVIGVFIEEGEIRDETHQLMKNIYNHHYLIVNNAKDLRVKMKPLLKKLLLKTI